MKKMETRDFLYETKNYDDDDYDDDCEDYNDADVEVVNGSSCREVAEDKNMFDIGAHIFSCLTGKKQTMCEKKQKHQDELKSVVMTTTNRASSKAVQLHQKGSLVVTESQEKDHENTKESLATNTIPQNPLPVIPTSTTCMSTTVKLHLSTWSLQSEFLYERFGSRYVEGKSNPRKFAIASPQCRHQHLLFKPEVEDNDKHESTTTVTIELACDARGDSYPNENCLDDSKNCINKLNQLMTQPRLLDVGDVDVLNCSCFEFASDKGSSNKMSVPKNIKTMIPFDVLNSITGYQAEVCSPGVAVMELDISPQTESCVNTVVDDLVDEVYCGICYKEGETPQKIKGFTSLCACNHWFCDDCWRVYISSQIDQGKTSLTCPAFDCKSPVDDPTIFHLAQCAYFKCLSIRQDNAFQMSEDWNWCPGDKCNLVAKVTSGSSRFIKSSTPCICTGCNTSWCFDCQKGPHWPATCEQAEIFRNRTKSFLADRNSADPDRITSVSVKRCPQCHYPIEKNGGCPNMFCTRCNSSFCWNCGGQFIDFRGCKCSSGNNTAQLEDIPLIDEIGNKRFHAHVATLMYHKEARNIESLVKLYYIAEDIEKAIDSYQFLHQSSRPGSAYKFVSQPHKFLAVCSKQSISKTLKLMVDIKIISHSVIEGASIQMATSATRKGHRKLQRLCDDLHFVIKRFDFYLAMRIEELCSVKNLHQIEALATSAKMVIQSIGKSSKNVK